jgi:hypothetical protein
MKTNNFDAMIKRLSSLKPKQLDTFLQDYHSMDEVTQEELEYEDNPDKELECEEELEYKDKDE